MLNFTCKTRPARSTKCGGTKSSIQAFRGSNPIRCPVSGHKDKAQRAAEQQGIDSGVYVATNDHSDVVMTGFTHDYGRIPVYQSLPGIAETAQHYPEASFAETMNQSEEAPGTDMGTGAAAAGPARTGSCVQPRSLRIADTHPLGFPGYRTGGGICAVMEALPRRNLCSTGITEQVTLVSGASCPRSLLRPSLCSGNSVFTPGRNQVRACRSLSIPATAFVDRHSVQLLGTSVMHDTTRNPAGLDRCTFTCNQRYFTGSGAGARTLGRFYIRYNLAKGRREGENITTVTAAKTPARRGR